MRLNELEARRNPELNFDGRLNDRRSASATPEEILERNTKNEVYRTPAYSYLPLLDYNPSWFEGVGFDPSAGDGRMMAEIAKRGNAGPHYLNDIRAEEEVLMRANLTRRSHHLAARPKWEVDVGTANSNIWDFAWFVFLPDYNELPRMDWLFSE